MNNRHGLVAAHVNDRTLDMWDRFKALARVMKLTNTAALEQAAEMWLANTRPDPWQAPAPVSSRLMWDETTADWIVVFESTELDDLE